MRVLALALLVLAPAAAAAQDPIVLEGTVPADAPPYFELPFTVPEGDI